MESLVGLVGYGSDGSDVHQQQGEPSPRNDNDSRQSAIGAPEEGGVSGGSGDLDENSDSRLGESFGEDGAGDRETRAGVTRASSFDAPAPPSKESRQFFMPLPSPLVRLDNASPGGPANSPFIPPKDGPGEAEPGYGVGGEDEMDEPEPEGGETERDGDVIKPEYRDMLPPEATGVANPQLQAKIIKGLNTIQGDFTKSIKAKKDYGNPAVLAQICHYCTVDSNGTNYPEDRMVHPSVYDTKDFHDSLMAVYRRSLRPDDSKNAAAAAASKAANSAAAAAAAAKAAAVAAAAAVAVTAPPVRPPSSAMAAARSAADAAVLAAGGAALSSSGNTRKFVKRWGNAAPAPAPPPSALPFIPRPMQIPIAPAAAASGSRVGFSADSVAGAARTALPTTLSAQAQAAKDAQLRAETIAKFQMIANRAKGSQDPSLKEQPPKKPRLS